MFHCHRNIRVGGRQNSKTMRDCRLHRIQAAKIPHPQSSTFPSCWEWTGRWTWNCKLSKLLLDFKHEIFNVGFLRLFLLEFRLRILASISGVLRNQFTGIVLVRFCEPFSYLCFPSNIWILLHESKHFYKTSGGKSRDYLSKPYSMLQVDIVAAYRCS